jgi:hypothetical protein
LAYSRSAYPFSPKITSDFILTVFGRVLSSL